MKQTTFYALLIGALLNAHLIFSQNVGINTTGAVPRDCSMLDVVSSTKGLLIPSLALTATGTYAPASGTAVDGLVVYNSATVGNVTPGFYYWSTTAAAWQRFNTGALTGWSTVGNATTVDGTNFLGTTDNIPFNFRVNNQKAGRISNNTANGETFFGYLSGSTNTTASGIGNTAIGSEALKTNAAGDNNTAIGYQALSTSEAADLTAIGYRAMASTVWGTSVVAIGTNTLRLSSNPQNMVVIGAGACDAFAGNIWHGVVIGDNAMGAANAGGMCDHNVVIGADAMSVNASPGGACIAIGADALENNNQSNNVAIGYQAAQLNTTGASLAIGYRALQNNTTGNFNTAIGASTLISSTGASNTAVGHNASYSNTSGAANTSLGKDALRNNMTGSGITAIGEECLLNTTGSTNTAVGYFTGNTLTTGTQNTLIGNSANVSTGGQINSTAIGYNTSSNATNKVRIGSASVTVIEGQVDWSFPSDGRFKTNVKEEVPGLAFINKLRPVTYNFQTQKFDEFLHKNDPNFKANPADYIESTQKTQSGFIAQEIEKAMIETGYEFSGLNKPADENGNYSVGYASFVVPLVKAVQELSAKNESLEAQIAMLTKKQNETDKALATQVEEILLPLLKSMKDLSNTNSTLLTEITLLKQKIGEKNAAYISDIEKLNQRTNNLEAANGSGQ